MRMLLTVLMALAEPSASAQSPPPPTVEVQLSSFNYSPKEIRLRAGQPVSLSLTNTSGGGHDFSAPDFFAAARILPGGTAVPNRGRIEVPSNQTRVVRLVPARGRYRLRCTHTLHSTLGMRGRIIVE